MQRMGKTHTLQGTIMRVGIIYSLHIQLQIRRKHIRW